MICDFELSVLEGDFTPGAATNAAVESLRGRGLLDKQGQVTERGKDLLTMLQVIRRTNPILSHDGQPIKVGESIILHSQRFAVVSIQQTDEGFTYKALP